MAAMTEPAKSPVIGAITERGVRPASRDGLAALHPGRDKGAA